MHEADKQSTGASSNAPDAAFGAPSEPGTAPAYPPMPVPTRTVIAVGLALWASALVVTLLVPSLHEGERSWWPWACAAGLALGALGYLYVQRGRGNAAGVT